MGSRRRPAPVNGLAGCVHAPFVDAARGAERAPSPGFHRFPPRGTAGPNPRNRDPKAGATPPGAARRDSGRGAVSAGWGALLRRTGRPAASRFVGRAGSNPRNRIPKAGARYRAPPVAIPGAERVRRGGGLISRGREGPRLHDPCERGPKSEESGSDHPPCRSIQLGSRIRSPMTACLTRLPEWSPLRLRRRKPNHGGSTSSLRSPPCPGHRTGRAGGRFGSRWCRRSKAESAARPAHAPLHPVTSPPHRARVA